MFPLMVPLFFLYGLCVPEVAPRKSIVEFVYMLPTSSTMSWGNPRSSIRAKSFVWSMELNVF